MLHDHHVLAGSARSWQFKIVLQLHVGHRLAAQLQHSGGVLRIPLLGGQFHTLDHVIERNHVGVAAYLYAKPLYDRQGQGEPKMHGRADTMATADTYVAAQGLYIAAHHIHSDATS